MPIKLLLICFFYIVSFVATGQSVHKNFFEPADSLNRSRLTNALLFTGITYTGFSIGLYHAWYKNYPQSSFHLFNDWGEWEHMDKVGHVYTAYLQGVLCYKGARWTGLEKKRAILAGIVCGSLFQSTIEVMDGFSSEWGFSLSDVGANVLGTSVFAVQQYFWDSQRFTLKVSSSPGKYSNQKIISEDGAAFSSLNERANSLFGRSFAERYLKDYNAQTYWLSVNIHDFLQKGNNWPDWLNIALGYGAGNMYGGYTNIWSVDGHVFRAEGEGLQRYRQFYLSPDIDLTRLKVRSPFLKTVFSVFNIFKMPTPALEWNTRGELIFHFIKI